MNTNLIQTSSSEHGPQLVVFGEILWDLLPDGAQPGGAPANVAVLAHAVGVDCLLASAVGDDTRGQEMLTRLQARGFPTTGIQQIPGAQTGLVDVMLSADGIPSYHILKNVAWDQIAATTGLCDAATEARAFYFGSLAQRAPQSHATLRQLFQLLRPECLCFFDVNLREPLPSIEVIRESLAYASVLKLNHEELPLMARWLELPADEAGFAEAMFSHYLVNAILLTKGPQGAELFERGKLGVHVPASPVEKIVDTVGAGDAFSAGFIAGCLRGESYVAATRIGSDLAARVCGNAGAWLSEDSGRG